MISYTLPEAESFFKEFGSSVAFISDNDEAETGEMKMAPYTLQDANSFFDHFGDGIKPVSDDDPLKKDPDEFIRKVIHAHIAMRTFIPVIDRIAIIGLVNKIIFEMTMDELPRHLNYVEPFISFVEWRLKLGKPAEVLCSG